MGDVGSLALGGTLGVIAVIIKQEVLLFFVGGVFVIEALSVILQVASYRLLANEFFAWRRYITILNWPAGANRK